MTNPKSDFPPVRACLFDMDGLLINTEDILTACHNILLVDTYSAPPITWTIKSQLQGRPLPKAVDLLLTYSNLSHVSRDEYIAKVALIQAQQFPNAQPLPGVEKLLKDLRTANSGQKRQQVHIALATSSHERHFRSKTNHLAGLFEVFPLHRRILGDDPRIPKGKGKPNPDIYLLALKVINESLEGGEEKISPEECLVFEDAVPGVIAGRRAGMRVIWVPHPGLAVEFKGREGEVLAGKGEKDGYDSGVVGDGWGEQLATLEDFSYEKYGIMIK